ncbi:MAG TPA: hypothetical protein VJC20_02995 [Candidatus Paceibacterota bacterium]
MKKTSYYFLALIVLLPLLTYIVPTMYQSCEQLSQLLVYKTYQIVGSIMVYSVLFLITFLLVLLSWRNGKAKIFVVITMIGAVVSWSLIIANINIWTYQAVNRRIFADVGAIETGLEQYYKDHKKFPSELVELKDATSDYLTGLVQALANGAYQDYPEYQYQYVVNGEQSAYVIKAVSINLCAARAGEIKQLFNDADGIILGVNCDDPVYCKTNKIIY